MSRKDDTRKRLWRQAHARLLEKAEGFMTEKMVAEVEVCQHAHFDEFIATIEALRAPDGCPWDREQTHQSIAHNMIEEAYEAVDAIESNDLAHLREELGDVLLQVVLQSQIAADAGEFTIDDVCADVNAKMIRRHPHVFGGLSAANANEVLDLWDQVKLAEKDDLKESPKGLLDGVPRSFPALMQAQKISRKAVSAGFEWETVDDVWDKVAEEVAELKAAYALAPKSENGKVLKEANPQAAEAVELECGDVFFAMVNVARKMGVNAENALRATCSKFRTRWSFMEGAAWGMGKRLEDMGIDEMEELWQMSKLVEAAAAVPQLSEEELDALEAAAQDEGAAEKGSASNE